MGKAAGGADNSVEGLVLDLWGDEQEEEPEEEGCAAEPQGQDGPPPERAPAAEEAGPAVRLAWSAAYGIKAACVSAAVFLASAIALTMVFNPDLTLLGAVNLFIRKMSEFLGGIGA